MSERKLPDPPAYDPRVEQTDFDEELQYRRYKRAWELAVYDNDPFICCGAIHYLAKDKLARDCLLVAIEKWVDSIVDKSDVMPLIPQNVRDALGLDK